MPIIKSAKKRVRVARKATVRNVKTKRSLKTALKAFHGAVTGKKSTTDEHRKAQSALDTAAKKGVMHKNKVARKKAQLSKTAKANAGVATTKKAAPKKAAAKPAAAKKSAATKPAAKATGAKKVAAKTSTVKKTAAKKTTTKK